MDGVHIPKIPTPTLARIRDLTLTDLELLLPLALILDRGLFETWSLNGQFVYLQIERVMEKNRIIYQLMTV